MSVKWRHCSATGPAGKRSCRNRFPSLQVAKRLLATSCRGQARWLLRERLGPHHELLWLVQASFVCLRRPSKPQRVLSGADRPNDWRTQTEHGPYACQRPLRRQDPLGPTLQVVSRPRQKALPHAWGAPGSGAPRGNKHALRHGRFTREAVAERKKIRELIRETRKLMRMIK